MNIALLGEFGSIEKNVIICLAVAGGFLVGYLLTGLIAHLFSKLMLRKQAPPRLARFLKLIGGAAAAVGVYLFLSGEGGFGRGGYGGGDTHGANTGKEAKTPPDKEASDEQIKKNEAKNDELKLQSAIRVYVLGAGSPSGQFFRFEDETQALTDQQLIDKIDTLDKAGKLSNKLIVIKSGAEHVSAPQYSIIYSKLRENFHPRGYRVLPLEQEPVSPKS